MKKHLLKSLLLTLMVLVGGSAWAGDKTVVKYSFDDANSPSLTAGSRVSFDYDKTSVITSTKFLNAWNNANGDPGPTTVSLGSTDLSGETWTLSFEWAACGGCNSKPDHTTLKAGDTNLFDLTGNSNWNTTVTLTYSGSDGTQTLPVPGCNKSYRFTAGVGNQLNTTDYWHHIVVTGSAEGVKMTITNSSTGTAVVENIVLSETNVNPTSLIIEPCCGGGIGIDELSLTYYVEGDVIQNPIINYTNVNGINRTVAATCDTEGAALYYSLDNETWTEGASVTVSESGKIYFKAVKGTSESDVISFDAVAGEAITLNAPAIVRSDNTTVTITADQSNLLLSPTANITYEYGNEKGSFTGSKVLTVAADATIKAYAEATGYTTSATSELAVALFPTYVKKIENTPAATKGWSANTFSADTKTVSERTYAALLLDDAQWGTNVYFQTDGAWGFRSNGNWYINSNTEESWILMPNMKKGDIIVVNVTYPASSTVNATFSKYSFGTQQAYEVTEDGNVEIAFQKPGAQDMDYLYGVYAYTAMTEAEIAFFDAKAAFQAEIAAAKAIDTIGMNGAADLAAAIQAAEAAAAAEDATVESIAAAKADLAKAITAFKAANFDIATAIANADFSADEAITTKICTYAKDVKEGEVANMQPLTGWTIVENGDAHAAGVFAYGSAAILGGDGGNVPAVGPNGETEGKVLGIEAVWSATTQYTQEVTLPAGEYLMEAVVYNAAGTGALSQNLIGIDGTYCTTKSYPVGKWTKDQVKITLAEAKTVTISIGVNSGNVGNGSAPHLFIDHIKLYGSEEIAAIELAAAKENALAEVNALPVGDALFLYAEAAISTAKSAVEAATTIDEVNAALATVKASMTKPAADKEYVITNKTAELALSIGNEAVKIEKEGVVKFTEVEGGWVLSNNAETPEYIFKTTANTWTFSTTVNKDEAYVVNFNLADGAYTIQGANGLFGTDSTDDGSTVYANKAQANNGLWTIAEVETVQPVEGISYSWESPEGKPLQWGGIIAYVNGDGDRLNYQNSGYYTICLNGKKANLPDTVASANAGYMLVTLDEALSEGDTIYITAYVNKNQSKKASAYIVFDNGAEVESEAYSDEANIDSLFNGVPTEKSIIVTAAMAGAKSFKMTRGQTGTNLFITKLQIIAVKAAEAPEVAMIKPTVGITEKYTSIADLEGKTFAIINEAEEKALYGINNQNLGYDTYGSAFSASNSGYLWKLVSLANDADAEVQGYYRFQLVTPSGADYNCWGMGGWLNSQPASGGCSFILGLNNQNGQDIKNGAVYDVQYVEGQGFTLKNIGTGLYQGANTLPANAEAPSYFTFAAIGTSYVPAVEALLAEGAAWKTIVKDDAALAAYDAAVAEIIIDSIKGDGQAEAKVVDAAIVELAKAQPAIAGADFTRAIINPSFELGNADGWTSNDGGWTANNGNFGAATGSFFVEKWTAAPNTLSDGSFLQTIKGLPVGKYKVTAELQNREQGNNDAAGTGLFLVANEGKTEAVTADGKTFEVIGTAMRGSLKIGTKLEGCSGNWICFDNFKLTFVEAVAAPVETTATFDFAAADFREKVGTAMADVNGNIYNETFTADGASLQITGGSAPSRIYVDNNRGQNLVTYKDYTTLTFKAPEGKAIVQIDFTAAGNSNINNFTASSGAIEGMTWTGEAEGVRFAQGGTSYLANAIVTMIDKTALTEALPAIEYTECANIAAFNALAAGTYAKITLTDAEVIGKSADGYSTVWIQDATGGCWIQYTSLNDKLNEKTKVNGTVYAVARPNSGNMQMKEAEATLQSTLEATAIASYTAIEGTLEEVNVAANLNKVVNIVADSLVMTSATAGKLYVGETTIDVTNGNATANQQLCKIADWEKGKKLEGITVEAILVGKSATANQLLPISIVNGFAQTLDVERYPGMGYGVTEATVDFARAKAYLGVEEITTDMLRIVNPDGSMISDYATYDGWFNGEGAAETWGDNTKINVKFFQAISEGKFEICDMNGADSIGATYTVKWALVANDKQVTYTINVKFVEAPEYKPEVVDTINVPVFMTAGVAYEGLTANFDVEKVNTALGITNIADAKAYIVNVTTGTFVENSTDGWRDANGDAKQWGEATNGVCVKINDPVSGIIDYLGAHDTNFQENDTYTAKWGFVANEKAVVVNIIITFKSAEFMSVKTIARDAQNADIYNINGQKVNKAQKGLYIINGKKTVVK